MHSFDSSCDCLRNKHTVLPLLSRRWRETCVDSCATLVLRNKQSWPISVKPAWTLSHSFATCHVLSPLQIANSTVGLQTKVTFFQMSLSAASPGCVNSMAAIFLAFLLSNLPLSSSDSNAGLVRCNPAIFAGEVKSPFVRLT
jgi:hypothetical protein